MTLRAAFDALQKGDTSLASRLLRHHLVHFPDRADAWIGLAAPFYGSGQILPALRLAERAASLDPSSPMIRNNLVALARAAGDPLLLLRHLTYLLARKDEIGLRLLRAEVAAALARLDVAQEDYRHVVRLDPGHLAGSVNLAAMLNDAGRYGESISLLKRAIAFTPASEPTWNNLSFAFLGANAPAEAMTAAGIATTIAPASLIAQMNRASALDALGSGGVDRALRRTIALGPNVIAALQALARRHSRAGAWDDFDRRILRARAVSPDDPGTAVALAQGHLIRGRMREGWRHWESRLRQPSLNRPDLQGQRWTGQTLAGETIVIHAEQGFGETLQFLRFVPRVAAMGARVILETREELAPLVARSLPDIELVDQAAPKPPHRYHCALPSLASVLDIGLDDLPGLVPYLIADPAGIERWRHDLQDFAKPRIGLCWRGNPQFTDDRRRSPGLSVLKRLLAVDAAFVSLTKAPTTEDRLSLKKIHDVADRLRSFDDTAALIRALDLVVTSDTATAHLAGGLGVPVWLLLAHAADWRWLLDRSDSPWYPTMRIFRQPAPGDWATVDEAVATALGNA